MQMAISKFMHQINFCLVPESSIDCPNVHPKMWFVADQGYENDDEDR